MNSFYSLQFPGAPDSFIGDLVTIDTIQQHWLQAGTQLQRNWFDSTRGLFNYYQNVAQDAQNLQSMVFGQYVSLFKSWIGEPESAVTIPQKGVAPGLSKAVSKQAEVEQAVSETPRLLGWVVDDFTRIQGIGKVLQQRLYEEGIVSYLQIASWDEKEIARIENEVLGSRFAGRVLRDQWQAQAEALMKG